MGTFLNDLRFGGRMLRKHPTFTLAAVCSLALGIGANSTVFSLLNAVLLSPLPVNEPARLVSVFTTDETNRGGFFTYLPTSRLNFEDYRDRNRVFSGVTAVMQTAINMSADAGEPVQINGELVSGNYFDLLGARLSLGRGFLPDEDRVPGAKYVAVLSHGFWQRRFGGAPDIIGRTITLNSQPFTVVGVAGPGFRGTNALGGPDVWAPLMAYPPLLTDFLREAFDSRRALVCQVVGRLAPGVTIEQATSNLQAIGLQLASEHPTDNKGRTATALPLAEATINPALRRFIVTGGSVLMTIVALVLLIACANVASLLLARAAAREREVAVRVSLGASRGQLVRQLLVESVLLALAGGGLGLVIAYWAQRALWASRPAFLDANAVDLSVDLRVLAFTMIVAVATGILFGLAPALHATRTDLATSLKDRSGDQVRRSRVTLRSALVVSQVALSLIALIAAGVFLRSLLQAQKIDVGFDPRPLGVITFDLSAQGYDETRGLAFLDRIRERALSIPGVTQVTFGSAVPLVGGGPGRTVFPEGADPTDRRNGRFAQTNQVSPEMFSVMGIPLVSGRSFREADTAMTPPVIVVNETMARQLWPGQDAVGKRFRFFGQKDLNEVVGVARDIKYNTVGEDPLLFVYRPLRQAWSGTLGLHVRAEREPGSVLGTLRQEMQQLDRTLPLTNVFTFEEVVHQALWAPRLSAWLLGLFAALSLVLAAVGLYGLLAYSVQQRTREIGLRMALGADSSDLRRLVVRQAVILTGAGLGIGLVAAWILASTVESILYGVAGRDLVSFVAQPLVLAIVALAAAYLPARRATKIDPVIALRGE